MLIKATKNGKTAVFSEKVWKTGQPQRYGWHSDIDEPLKKLPAEILEFAEIRKKIKTEPVPEPVIETIPENKPKAKRKPTKK